MRRSEVAAQGNCGGPSRHRKGFDAPITGLAEAQAEAGGPALPLVAARSRGRTHAASRFGPWIWIGVLLLLRPPARGETAVWRVESPSVQKQVSVSFGPGAADNRLVILSLLGPQRELLPGGRFLLWVGYRDGTPLANKPVTVRTASPGNLLVGEGESTAEEVTVRTDAVGLAEVYLTPQPEGDGGGGGEEEPPPT